MSEARQDIARLSREAVAALDKLQDAVVTAVVDEDVSALGSIARSFEEARAFLAFWANPEKEAKAKGPKSS